jgi:hypothetical protein
MFNLDRMLDHATTSIPLAVFGAGIILYLVYQWALPKPLAGIPYNKASSQRLLGDIPEMMVAIQKTDSLWPWVASLPTRYNSPIFQIWARPFSAPWVMLYDFRESQDILLRRTKEFDRSPLLTDLFSGILPDHHISKLSADPKFKHNRALLKDLMTPRFLHEVAAPQIYSTVETLLDLWNKKLEIAKGHPFSGESDLFHGALDAIFAATFGLETEDSVLYSQKQFLDLLRDLVLPEDIDKPVVIPETENPAEFEAILTLAESVETATKSPVPRLAYWLLKQLPYMRRAFRTKEATINTEIDKAVERIQSEKHVKRSAIDDILRREQALAAKEGRVPFYHSREISDEVLF